MLVNLGRGDEEADIHEIFQTKQATKQRKDQSLADRIFSEMKDKPEKK